MYVIGNIFFLTCVLCVVNSVSSSPIPDEGIDEQKDSTDSSGGSEKDIGTVSPSEETKLKDEMIGGEEEDSEKFSSVTNSPEDAENTLNKEEKEHVTKQSNIEKSLIDTDDADDFKNLEHLRALFDKAKTEASGNDGEEEIEKSPAEMKEIKAELFKETNQQNERLGLPKVSHETFDKFWNMQEEEYGKQFPGIVEIVLQKQNQKEEEPATTVKEVSEVVTQGTTPAPEVPKEPPKGTFVLRNAKEKICILAKFHSTITITYPGKTSEQKFEVTIPPNSNTKGKCAGPNRPPSLQLSWGKFIFSLSFNKTSEDTWSVTLVELIYDTSEPIFDGAVDRGKITAKSKQVNLFETPFGKSYFCPAQEVILYSENQHIVTVNLKEVHLQPYDVEDGKFSTSHRCNQVVIGGPGEEPFVQDETIPLAVGCTLALITLLILVGFSVHRAYNAAKVDYNTME